MNWYAVLGVDPNADHLIVRRAYRRLVRRLHPELYPASEAAAERYALVVRAWEVLGDPRARERYDADESEGLAPPSMSAQGAARPRAVDKLDLEAEVSLSFEEAISGLTLSLSLQRESTCGECGGSRREARRCQRCRGTGRRVELERVRLRIPPGVESGYRVHLAGRGHRHLGRAGDAVVTIDVEPHPVFERRGRDLYCRLPLTLLEAVFGGEVEVPTLTESVRLRIPPGTSAGRVIRVPGRGLPGGRREESGHLFCETEIVLPKAPSASLRRALEALEEEDPRSPAPSAPPSRAKAPGG